MNQTENLPVPQSWLGRLLYAAVTIVLPIISFAIAFDGRLGPEWQSGQLGDYALLMLSGKVAIVFYPFLAYAMACMLLLLVAPLSFSGYFAVRFGIYSGVVLSLQYAILLGIFFSNAWHLLLVTHIIPFLHCFYLWIKKLFGLTVAFITVLSIIFGGIPCFWLIYFFITGHSPFSLESTLLASLLILACGPSWCLVIAIVVSNRLIKNHETFTYQLQKQGLISFTWLLSYGVAWRLALSRTVEAYAALPTSSSCYIATAAAKGHPQIVQAQPTLMADGGTIMWLNRQVRYFKCAELALMTITPRGHRLCRAVYDCVGHALAGLIVHPLVADGVYFSLKPFEWTCRIILRILLPNFEELVSRVYADEEPD